MGGSVTVGGTTNTDTPASPESPGSSWWSTWGFKVYVVLYVALVLAVAVTNWPSPRRSVTNGICNNLRAISGAVDEWAIEHHQTGVVTATWSDLAPYLTLLLDSRGSIKSVAGERYVLKPLPESAEAVLTRKVGAWPKGTVYRLTANGCEITPPAASGGNASR